jgi:hypothetical protein
MIGVKRVWNWLFRVNQWAPPTHPCAKTNAKLTSQTGRPVEAVQNAVSETP